jgi:hypothetical protein
MGVYSAAAAIRFKRLKPRMNVPALNPHAAWPRTAPMRIRSAQPTFTKSDEYIWVSQKAIPVGRGGRRVAYSSAAVSVVFDVLDGN